MFDDDLGMGRGLGRVGGMWRGETGCGRWAKIDDAGPGRGKRWRSSGWVFREHFESDSGNETLLPRAMPG